MRIPRKALLPSCAALCAFAYYQCFATYWGNYYHSGGPAGAVTVEAFAVLAAYACLEVARTEKFAFLRVLAALFFVPLALFVGFALYYGLKAYVSA
jgi:hypothetical protein